MQEYADERTYGSVQAPCKRSGLMLLAVTGDGGTITLMSEHEDQYRSAELESAGRVDMNALT